MIGITRAAAFQVDALLRFYLEKERPEAAVRLRQDLAIARSRIEEHPESGADHPRPYPTLNRFGFRWVMVRAYWISWRVMNGVPIITNVVHASADIEKRAVPTTDDYDEW